MSDLATLHIEGLDTLHTELKGDIKKIKRAARNAVNTTATATRKESFKIASQDYNVQQGRLKKDSGGNPTTFINKAKQGESTAIIEYRGGKGSGDRPGLQHYKTDKQERNLKRKGWKPTYKIRRAGATEKVERGFYGIGKLKGRGIFQRKEIEKKITRKTGPGIKQILEDGKMFKKIKKTAEDILVNKTEEQIDKLL